MNNSYRKEWCIWITLTESCALFAACFGCATLIGWITGFSLLSTLKPEYIPIAPSTAFLFILYGTALFFHELKPHNRRAYWFGVLSGFVGLLISLILFILSSFGIHFNIETLGLRIAETANGTPIGFMSPITAFCFILAGISFLQLLSSNSDRIRRVATANILAFIILLVGAILSIGYIMGAPLFYGSVVIPPALTTSISFLFLGTALCLSSFLRAKQYNGLSGMAIMRNTYPVVLVYIFSATCIFTSCNSYFRNYKMYFRTEMELQLTAIADLKVRELAQWRKERLGDASIFFRNNLIYEYVQRIFKNPSDLMANDQIQEWLLKVQTVYQYDRIVLYDNQHIERLSIPHAVNPPVPNSLLQTITEALRSKRIVFSDFSRDTPDHPITISILVPILDKEESSQPLGVLVLQINPAVYLYPLIQTWPNPSRSAESLLVRRDGDEVLFLNELRHQKNTALQLSISLSQTDIPAVMAVQGKTGIVWGIDYRGKEVLAVLKAIPDSPWFMVCKVDAEEVFTEWHNFSTLLLALILVLLIAAAAVVGMIWQRNEKSHYRNLLQTEEALRESEERIRLLVATSMDAVLLTTPQGDILSANPAACQMFGYTEEELQRVGRKGVADESDPRVQAALEERAQTGRFHGEIPLKRRDGTTFLAEISSVVFGASESQLRTSMIVRDVTERNRAEELLRESELRYRILANSGQGLIWTSGVDKKCDYFNQPWLEFTGRTLEQELGDGWVEGVHPDDLDYCVKIYSTAFDRRERFSMIYRLRRSDGEYRWIQDDGMARYDSQGHFLGYIGHCLDITKLKRTEEALEQTEKTLRAIFDNTNDGILVAEAANGKFVIANQAICRMLGYNHNELLHLSVKDIHPVEEFPYIYKQFERQVRGEITFANNIIVKRKDETTFYADINSSIVEIGGRLCNVGIFRDITERRRVEESARIQSMRIQLLLELHEISTSSQQKVLDFCLDASLRISQSNLSFIGFLDENESVMTIYAWSQSAMDQCAIQDKPILFPVEGAGIWAECIRQRKPVAINDYDAPHPAKKGYPPGHMPLTRLLCVPVFEGQRIVIVTAIANKETDYDEGDVLAVSVLMNKMWEIWRHKQDEETLRISEERYRQFFEQNLAGTLLSSADGCLIDCNPAYLKIFGFSSKEEALKTDLSILYPNPKDCLEFLHALKEKKHVINIEKQLKRLDGKPVHTIENNYGIFNDRGDLIGVRSYIFDNTERKLIEEQFRQAQKMEAVGRLAGGVAHDFNNIIMAIRGYSDLVLRSLPHDHIAHRDIQEIKKAADRAASLTRQLLAFARKETINPQVLDLNDAVSGILKMIQRLVGEDIELNWTPGKDLFRVKVDPSQFDQILVNLAVNARDAISGVGNITIETANTKFDEAYCACHAGALPGEYVLLTMSDDGCGMDKETLTQIFEPFFTTKEMGKGTGLGLAAVFGAIKQNDGFINVYSEPGQGTTFRIYLPRFTSGTICTPVKHAEETARGGKETLLLVEDDAGVLVIGKRMLEELGYTVLIANTPKEAMRLAEETTRTIHLLITDVVMPEMNGRELAARLVSMKPAMKCLFMSGYTANVIAHRGILEEGVHFIQKPFSEEALADKVREALDDPVNRI